MLDLNVTKLLAKDILSGKSKYLKNKKLKFNRIVFHPNIHTGTITIEFWNNLKLLCTSNCDYTFSNLNNFVFDLADGNMALSMRTL